MIHGLYLCAQTLQVCAQVIYLYSWHHLLQNPLYMYSWSRHLCQCSWHWGCMYVSPVHTHWYLKIQGCRVMYSVIKLPSSKLLCLTCTVDTISRVTRVAGAGVTPHCVNALCTLMAVVQVITLTFINICMKAERVPYEVSVQPSGYSNGIICLSPLVTYLCSWLHLQCSRGCRSRWNSPLC